jgi:hypothetical protein
MGPIWAAAPYPLAQVEQGDVGAAAGAGSQYSVVHPVQAPVAALQVAQLGARVHAVQVVAPGVAAKEPAPHGVHRGDTAPAAREVPTGHWLHVEEAGVSLP